MNKVLLAITCVSLGLVAGTLVPRSQAQTFALPHSWEYQCVDELPGRDDLEHYLAFLNSQGQTGWRYLGPTPTEFDTDGFCFERAH